MLFAIKRALINECFNHQLIGHLLIEVMKFGIRVLLVVMAHLYVMACTIYFKLSLNYYIITSV